jgi:hypothetical protein
MRPHRLNRNLVLVGCAAGLVGAGLGAHLARDTTRPPEPTMRAPMPGRRTAKVPSELSNDPCVAALRYVLNGQALLDAGPDGVDALLAPVVAPSARRELVDENRRNVARVRADLSAATGPIRWRQAPLAVRVDARGDAATVAVWHVGVLSAPGAAPPQSHWATSTVELANQDGAWKVTSETVVDGPVPLNPGDSAPDDAAAFDDSLAGFVSPGAP